MAIVRDGSSAFPILAGNSGTLTSVTTATFNVAAGSVIVVATGYENVPGNNVTSLTVSWAAGGSGTKPTFTKRSEAASTPTTNGFSSIWTATATDALSGVAVTSAAGASSGTAILTVGVDALVGATEAGGQQNSVFHSGSGANNVTVNGITTNSWIYVAQWSENGTADSPVANTTELREDAVGGSNRSAVGVNTTGTSGNISVGWSATDSYNGVAAYEILNSPSVNLLDSVVAFDAVESGKYRDAYTVFQTNAFQSTAFPMLGSSAGADPNAKSASESDSALASDSAVAQKFIPSLLQTDTALASDSEAYRLGLSYGTTDSAQASDSEAVAITKNVGQTDTALASDSEAVQRFIPSLSQTDTALANDSLAYALGLQYGFSDSVLASDVESFTLATPGGGTSVDQLDVCSASDSLACALAAIASQSDTASASDSVLSSVAMAQALSDSALASDSVALAFKAAAILQDSALASDSMAAAGGTINQSGTMLEIAVASDAMAAMKGGGSINATFKVWSGSAWVYWDGTGWV